MYLRYFLTIKKDTHTYICTHIHTFTHMHTYIPIIITDKEDLRKEGKN